MRQGARTAEAGRHGGMEAGRKTEPSAFAKIAVLLRLEICFLLCIHLLDLFPELATVAVRNLASRGN